MEACIGLLAQFCLAAPTALSGFIQCHQNQHGKGDRHQRNRHQAVELFDFSIQQRQPGEDEEQVRAIDMQRGFAQSQKWLDCDHAQNIFPQPIKHHHKSQQIQNPERADLPFVQPHSQRLLRQVRPQPAMPHTHEEQADSGGHSRTPGWDFPQRNYTDGRGRAQPQACNPNRLPGKQVEGSCLLQRNSQVRHADDCVMRQISQAELSQQPHRTAGCQNPSPPIAP